jgi:hypothetical protein
MRFLPTPYVSPARAHRVAGGDPDDEGRLVELAKVVDESDIGQRAFAEASLRAPAATWGDSALV